MSPKLLIVICVGILVLLGIVFVSQKDAPNSQETATTTVRVFFGRNDAPAGMECTTVEAIERTIQATEGVGRAALEELLKGLAPNEDPDIYTTSIPPDVQLQSLTIVDGVAYADFSLDLETGVAGSCRVTHIRRQIEETLKQFPTVTSVIISVDGRTEDVLQP